MNLPEFSVRHPVSITMLIVILVGLGLMSIFGLPVEMFPEIEFPMISVMTDWEGVAPQELEERVTKPVERAVAAVEDVKRIRSFTTEGRSFVAIEFNWGADTDLLRIDVREKLDAIRSLLPTEIDDPIISRMTVGSDEQAIRLAAASETLPLPEVRRLAEDVLKARFESIDGVATVEVYGGLEREVQINVLPAQLQAYGLSLSELVGALQLANLNHPGGRFDRGADEFLVRTVGKFRSLEEIRRLAVRSRDGAQITVGDVAEVTDTHKEVRSLSRFNGKPTVELAVLKETQGNTVAISDAVKDKLSEIERQYPQLALGVAFDAAPYIRRSIADVQGNAAWGGFFAVLVLWPFLSNRRWRVFGAILLLGSALLAAPLAGEWLAASLGAWGTALAALAASAIGLVLLRLLWRSSPATLVISLAMPISIIATFILIKFADLTLNMVSLGGLALGIGMLVDNSVVVIENISRHMALGKASERAAIDGTSEVWLPILLSTLTTLAVFLPIAWIEGIAREVFNDLSLTVSFSLTASLVVAVTIVPMLASKFLVVPAGVSIEDRELTPEEEARVLDHSQRWLRAIVHYALDVRRSALILVVSAGVFALAVVGIAFYTKGFFPDHDAQTFAVSLKLPRGTAFSVLDRASQRAEAVARRDADVSGVFASVRAGDRILVGVTLRDGRRRHSKDIQADLRRQLADLPDAELGIQTFDGGARSRPLDVHVVGDDPQELARLGTIVKQRLETVPGAVDVRSSLEKGRPEVRVEVDRLRVADHGLSVRRVAEVVETAMEGRVAGQFTDRGEEVDIRVQYKPSERADLERLRELVVRNDAGAPVELHEIAAIRDDRGPVEIRRIDQRRTVQVESNLEKGFTVATVARQLASRLGDVPFPVGYTWTFSGEEERRSEAFHGLALSLAIALVLVYMLMAAMFESLMQPFVIMLTMPLAIVGVYLGLVIFGQDLTVPAYVGIIMLAGIVVNNAIVLLDFVNRLRERGLSRRDALALGSAVRLRPILMTAGTTVLGMLPLALGIGRGQVVLQGLAAAVMGGLIVSTVLTLVVIPCAYDACDRLAERVRRAARDLGFRVSDRFAEPAGR